MAQQTAVEWLVRQLSNEFIGEVFLHRWSEVSHLIDKAKQMEKEQIIDAFDTGTMDDNLIGNEYYKETYNK